MTENKQTQLKYLSWFIGFFCLIELVNLISGRLLNQFSILPRDLSSLAFILSAPFLHANLHHFLSNIITLAVFAVLLLQYGNKHFIKVSILLILSTGILVWLFGRQAYHLGASGLVYGYFAYLVLAGWMQKRILLMIISVGVAFLYGGIIWGVLPSRPYISWESHLFGFISGLALAWLHRVK
ncbi:rhomboid family intramembrane serine protease [Agaribacter flavus]|uniref:Rhomboid family intramembrane serine protease n=1 Tax=Agaribacter flavus TaxID=1902781 RepID=A0ABV7FKD6_9ALTE